MLELNNLLETAGYKISDSSDSYENFIQSLDGVTKHDYYQLSIEKDLTSLNYVNFQIDTVIGNLSREMLIFDTLSSLINNRSTEAANTYFEIMDKLGMSVEDLEEKSQNIFQKIWEAIKTAFRKIGELFGKIIRWFKNLFSGKKREEDKEIQEEIPKVVEEVKSENTKKINEKFFKLTETMKSAGDNIIVDKAKADLFHGITSAFYKKSLATFNKEAPKMCDSVVKMLGSVGEKGHDKNINAGSNMASRVSGNIIKAFNSTFGVEINEGSMKAVDKVVNRVFYGTDAPQKQKVSVRNIILKIPQSVLDNKIHVFSNEIDSSLVELKKAMDDMNRSMDKYGQIAKKHKQDKKVTKDIIATFNSVKTGYSFLLQFAYKFKKEAESIRNVYKKAFKLYKKYTVSEGDKSDIEVSDKEKKDYDDAMKLKEHVEKGGKVEL